MRNVLYPCTYLLNNRLSVKNTINRNRPICITCLYKYVSQSFCIDLSIYVAMTSNVYMKICIHEYECNSKLFCRLFNDGMTKP